MTIQLTEEQIASILVKDKPSPAKSGTVIMAPTDIVEELKHMGMLDREHFTVVTLSSRNHVLGKHTISVGTLDAALVHPRETYRTAILDNAAKIIIAHNHPSGDTNPSEDDQLITKRLVTAGKVIGIQLIDHIIIAGDSFESMQRLGMMNRM